MMTYLTSNTSLLAQKKKFQVMLHSLLYLMRDSMGKKLESLELDYAPSHVMLGE